MDPVLGVVTDIIAALDSRCQLAVIANEVGVVPSGGRFRLESLQKERGKNRTLRGLRYLKSILRLAVIRRADAILVHMSPIYLLLASPFAKLFGIKTILWYAHPRRSPSLLLTERLASAVATSLPNSYPGKRPVVHVLGQAIDVQTFVRIPMVRRTPLRLVAIGRTSPSKGYDFAIRAIAQAVERGISVNLRIVGPSTTPAEVQHRRQLQEQIDRLKLQGSVSLEDGIPRSQVPQLLGSAHALLNTTVEGSGDKAIFEAMAMGRPPLVSNHAFAPLLTGLFPKVMFKEGDIDDLVNRIASLSQASTENLELLSKAVRARVEDEHSLDHWADGVINLLGKSKDLQGV